MKKHFSYLLAASLIAFSTAFAVPPFDDEQRPIIAQHPQQCPGYTPYFTERTILDLSGFQHLCNNVCLLRASQPQAEDILVSSIDRTEEGALAYEDNVWDALLFRAYNSNKLARRAALDDSRKVHEKELGFAYLGMAKMAVKHRFLPRPVRESNDPAAIAAFYDRIFETYLPKAAEIGSEEHKTHAAIWQARLIMDKDYRPKHDEDNETRLDPMAAYQKAWDILMSISDSASTTKTKYFWLLKLIEEYQLVPEGMSEKSFNALTSGDLNVEGDLWDRVEKQTQAHGRVSPPSASPMQRRLDGKSDRWNSSDMKNKVRALMQLVINRDAFVVIPGSEPIAEVTLSGDNSNGAPPTPPAQPSQEVLSDRVDNPSTTPTPPTDGSCSSKEIDTSSPSPEASTRKRKHNPVEEGPGSSDDHTKKHLVKVSSEEIDTYLALREAGTLVSEIAEEMNISLNRAKYLYQVAKETHPDRIHSRRRRYSSDEYHRAAELYNDNKTYKEIAASLGITKSQAIRLISNISQNGDIPLIAKQPRYSADTMS